jgi:hypothetical protein
METAVGKKKIQEKDVLLFARRRTFTSLTCERRGGLAGTCWVLGLAK